MIMIMHNFRLGNWEYRRGNYVEAIKMYTTGLSYIKDTYVLYLNRAACYYRWVTKKPVKVSNHHRSSIHFADFVNSNVPLSTVTILYIDWIQKIYALGYIALSPWNVRAWKPSTNIVYIRRGVLTRSNLSLLMRSWKKCVHHRKSIQNCVRT